MAKTSDIQLRKTGIASTKPVLHTALQNITDKANSKQAAAANPKEEHVAIVSRNEPLSNFTHNLGNRHGSPQLLSKSASSSLKSLCKLDTLTSSTVDENSYCDAKADSQSIIPVLNCKHFLEVSDTQHRYGTYLQPYYEIWTANGSKEPFFEWLDEGNGRHVEASHAFPTRPHCIPRKDLANSRVHYCSEDERKRYRVHVRNRKLVWASMDERCRNEHEWLVDTGNGEDRWIFVIDEKGQMFVNKKKKARFHHSSFVSGRPVRAAGRLVVANGDIISISPNSGHYLTSLEQLKRAVDDFFQTHADGISVYVSMEKVVKNA